MLRARNILITSFIIDSTDIIYTENMLHGRHSVISIIDVVGALWRYRCYGVIYVMAL